MGLFDKFKKKSNSLTIEEIISKDYRVKGVIRTCLKASIFKSFRRFGLARRQPYFTLNTKNPIKIFRFVDRRFFIDGFMVGYGENGANPDGLASISTQRNGNPSIKNTVRIIPFTLIKNILMNVNIFGKIMSLKEAKQLICKVNY